MSVEIREGRRGKVQLEGNACGVQTGYMGVGVGNGRASYYDGFNPDNAGLPTM